MKSNLRNRVSTENIQDVYIIIAVIAAIIYVIFPTIIFGWSDLDNDVKDFAVIYIINILIIVIPIFVFEKLVQLKPKIELTLIFLFIIQFSISPQIFYKIYKENPDSYTFENKFIKYVKKENEKKITINNYFLLQNQHYYDSLLTLSNSFEKLPFDRDTLIKLDEKTIVLCPSERRDTEGGIGIDDCKIRIYDITKGVELFSFPKNGKSLNSSYKFHKQNLKNNMTSIATPEIGINYLDFWLSAITGFNTSEIVPISTFTRLLSKIVLGLTLLILGLVLGQLKIFEILRSQKQEQT